MSVADVGVLLPTRALLLKSPAPTDLEPILGLAEDAEAAGYGSVWVGDSLLASPRPEAVVTLAALAARTRRVRIGSAILIGSLRHPVHMAHQLATVDVVSGGRLTVGVGYSSGTGVWKTEHDLVGVDAGTRHARTRESIEAMRALWSGPGAACHGRFFDFEGVDLEPRPVQPGGPPIWIHGMRGEKTLRRVAALGDGWINNLPTPDAFAAGWTAVRAHLETGGRAAGGFGACHYSTVRVETDGASARRHGRAFMQSYYGGMDPDAIERTECCRFGTPGECAAALADFVRAGASTLVVRFAGDDQREQFDLFTRQVLPHLRSGEAGA